MFANLYEFKYFPPILVLHVYFYQHSSELPYFLLKLSLTDKFTNYLMSLLVYLNNLQV